MERNGVLFVLSGPSGAGKGTVLQRVLNDLQGLAVSVSATTREPRVGEIDGIHYHFCTKEEFLQKIQNNEFLEFVSKFKNMYGTPKSQVEKLLEEGTDVILEIETRGAIKIKRSFPKAILIFVTPSDFEELGRRLNKRNSDTDKAKQLRLRIAKKEINSIKRYDYIAINDDLDECTRTVKSIIVAERSNIKRNKFQLHDIIKIKEN